MDAIYLDYNGSAPLDPRVAEIMASALTQGLGNASAIHRFGRRQAAAADEAREQVAAMVGGRASGVIFTSGATEANNLALRGAVEARPRDRRRILVSAVEHASVARTAEWLRESGQAEVDVIRVTPGGFVAVSAQAAALEGQVLEPDTRAFVLTLANDAAESDHDWVRAAATVVARKAPSEWADEDVVRFRRELPHRVAAFQRLAALHADGGGALDALRVILTRPDGSEHVRWVGMDENERSKAEDALDAAVARLARVTGSSQRAHRVLLAPLGERLLPVPPEAEGPSPRNARRAANG
jgi:hypothetical protein